MTRDAFVIMPFSDSASATAQEWTDTFDYVFKPAFVAAGYTCERAQPVVGGLVDSIVERLRNAAVVLADVTDRNANVFYELGVRHAMRKGTILVSRDGQLPSDLAGQWYLQYGTTPAKVARFQQEIARLLEFIAREPERADNPIAAYLDRESLTTSSMINRENAKKIGALITEMSGNLVVLRGIAAGKEKGDELSVGCLNLLCETFYVDLGPSLMAKVYELRNRLKKAEAGRPVDVSTLLNSAQDMMEQMGRIRERLLRGEYTEPATLSLMAWSESSERWHRSPDLLLSEMMKRLSSDSATCEWIGNPKADSHCMICGAEAPAGICRSCGSVPDRAGDR
jgi:hypothetical protein